MRTPERAPDAKAAAALLAALLLAGLPACRRPGTTATPGAGAGDEVAESAAAAEGEPQIVVDHPVDAPGGPPATTDLADLADLDRPQAAATPSPLVPVLETPAVAPLIAFYGDGLGFEVTFTEPAEPPFRRAELTSGPARLVLVARPAPSPAAKGAAPTAPPAAEPPPPAAGELRFEVDDVAAVADRLAAQGIELETTAAGDEETPSEIATRDPDGRRVVVTASGAG